MAYSTISDIIGPRGENIPVLNTYLTEAPVEKTAFWRSGVLTTTPFMQAVVAAPSVLTAIPFWKPIDASTEPNYSTDNYNDVAVPRSVSTGLQKARIAFLNDGFGSADLVPTVTKQDPLEYVASVIDNYWQRQAQKRLIATVLGIYNDNIGATDAFHTQNDMVTNPGTVFDANAFIDAQAQFGDGGPDGTLLDGLGTVVVHRLVYTQMQKQNLIDFVTDSEANTRFAFYQGRRIVVDDSMPILGSGADRTSLVVLFGPGAIGYAEGAAHTPLEYERNAARANGGGVEALWSRRNWLLHPLGYSFLSAKITGNGTEERPASASWADLADATNWQREVTRKHIPLSFLVVKLA